MSDSGSTERRRFPRTLVYDTCLMVAQVTPLGYRTSYSYDAAANRTGVQDANGNRTTTVYANTANLPSATGTATPTTG